MDWGIIITALVGVIGSFLTWLGVRSKAKTDEKAASVPALIAGWEKRAEKAEERMAVLEKRLDEALKRANSLDQENRYLRDQVRDQAELIDDFVAHVASHDAWVASGSAPPPPVMTWRIRERLRQERAMHADQITQQQED